MHSEHADLLTKKSDELKAEIVKTLKELAHEEDMLMNGRFDYVKYDADHQKLSQEAKELVEAVEKFITAKLLGGRSASLALTKLEECHMWLGKSIRDRQAIQ